MRVATLLSGAVSALFASICLAQSSTSACTGQQYNDIPGFPAYNSGCYPLNYYQTSDLGQTSPSDAQTRCESQCTSMGSQCVAVVAQVNKAADSNLYSGTCFFYSQTPTGPRQCADTAYLVEGYMKDSTNVCFSSSSTAATAFCSSYLGIPVITSTATSTPALATATATFTTTSTIYTTLTVSATSTATATMSSTSLVTVATATTTATVTTTTTTTTITTVTSNAKNRRQASTIPPPACVTSGTPATRLSAACSCLSIQPSTSTTTTTLSQLTTTTTATATAFSTSTQTTTVTSATITTTTTIIISVPTTATVTATTTTTSTQTVTATATATASGPRGPSCTDPDNDQGVGGCSTNCYCDARPGYSYGVCDSANECGSPCSTDTDCPTGQACATGPNFVTACGGPACVAYTSCSSAPRGPSCNDPDNLPGAGGCSDDCFCDARPGYSYGVCDTALECGSSCSTDADCPTDQACATGPNFVTACGGPACVAYTSCSSSYTTKRKLLARSSLRDTPIADEAPEPKKNPNFVGAAKGVSFRTWKANSTIPLAGRLRL